VYRPEPHTALLIHAEPVPVAQNPYRRTPASFRFDVDAVSRRREGEPLALAKSVSLAPTRAARCRTGPVARKPTPCGIGSPLRASNGERGPDHPESDA
jgi:hypothetical protein